MTIVFVNYGPISNNSANHILNFARELKCLGHRVFILSYGNSAIAPIDGGDDVVHLSYAQFSAYLKNTSSRCFNAKGTLLHAWTPRENVRSFVEKIASRWNLSYLVHLEDNEMYVTAAHLGVTSTQLLQMSKLELWRRVPSVLSKPHRMKEFLKNALAVTIITPTLADFCPPGKRWLLLEPGVDSEFFRPVHIEVRETILRELCLTNNEKYVVYNGNTHAANKPDVEALYLAISALRGQGKKIKLIRTGLDHTRPDPSVQRMEDWLIEVGVLDRSRLVKFLQIADFFVQPGALDEFNAYRLPSKIPECLAMGRPVIMPRTNIGLRARDGQDVVLMSKGDSDEIVAKLQFLMENPDLAARIGASGRNFAIENFSWSRSARALSDFYTTVLRCA
jgi:glycosyltransferase involved in cell wall biosynthesis